jgi:hypothetical protein
LSLNRLVYLHILFQTRSLFDGREDGTICHCTCSGWTNFWDSLRLRRFQPNFHHVGLPIPDPPRWVPGAIRRGDHLQERVRVAPTFTQISSKVYIFPTQKGQQFISANKVDQIVDIIILIVLGMESTYFDYLKLIDRV